MALRCYPLIKSFPAPLIADGLPARGACFSFPNAKHFKQVLVLLVVKVVWKLVFSLGETILVVEIRWRVLAFIVLEGIHEVSVGKLHSFDSQDFEVGDLDCFSSTLHRSDKVLFLENKAWLNMVAQKDSLLASRRKLGRPRSILFRVVPVDHLGTERDN